MHRAWSREHSVHLEKRMRERPEGGIRPSVGMGAPRGNRETEKR